LNSQELGRKAEMSISGSIYRKIDRALIGQTYRFGNIGNSGFDVHQVPHGKRKRTFQTFRFCPKVDQEIGIKAPGKLGARSGVILRSAAFFALPAIRCGWPENGSVVPHISKGNRNHLEFFWMDSSRCIFDGTGRFKFFSEFVLSPGSDRGNDWNLRRYLPGDVWDIRHWGEGVL
jgi:hypothetical protein